MSDKYMTDRQFDDKIREMLAEPQEHLPAGLWDGIEARLDAVGTGRRKAAVVPWRRVVAGVTSAAAAVALLFVCGYHFLLKPTPEADTLAENAAFDVVAPSEGNSAVQLALAEVPEAPKRKTYDSALPTPAAADESIKAMPESVEVTENLPEPVEVTENLPEPVAVAEDDVVKTEDGDLFDVDSVPAPECEIKVDNSDIDEAYGKEDEERKRLNRLPLELSVGGNSFGGPQKSSGPRKMFVRGNRDSFTGRNFVEGTNSDSYSLPLSFGVGLRYRITNWFGVGIGVNYTLLGKKVSGVYYDEKSGPHSIDMKNSQHYIGIPLDVYFSMFRTPRWDVYASLGGSVEKCVLNSYSGMLEGENVSHKPKVGGVQTSLKAGFGLEFSPVDFLGIYIDPSVRYYFNNDQPRSIRTAQPLAFGVEAGLRFRL